MAAPVLLVHDDLATIASVRRLLAREGFEVILATSAADALIAFGHYLPGLVVLAPSVEGGRGQVVMEELAIHPDRGLARVLLLGESIPGFAAAVVPVPLDAPLFLEAVARLMRDPPNADEWKVVDRRHETGELPVVKPSASAPEPWRATAPPEIASLHGAAEDPQDPSPDPEEPQLEEADWALATMSRDERQAHEEAAERARAGELAVQAALEETQAAVEEEALRSAESSLELEGAQPASPELLAAEAEREAEAWAREEAELLVARLRAELDSRALQEQAWARREAELRAELELEAYRRADAETALAQSESQLTEAQRALESALETTGHALRERDALTDRIAALEAELEQAFHEQQALTNRLREQEQERDAAPDAALLAERDALLARVAELETVSADRGDAVVAAALVEQFAADRESLLARVDELEAEVARLRGAQANDGPSVAVAASAGAAMDVEPESAAPPLEHESESEPAHEPVLQSEEGELDTAGLARRLTLLTLGGRGVALRVDLQAEDAERTLWLDPEGRIAGAASSLLHESLLDRARADGLIDTRAATELRLLRGMSPAELIEQLRARGHLREQELVPLLQRHAEGVVLEALSEPHTRYRIHPASPPEDMLLASPPRGLWELALEALKRTLDGEAWLMQFGGLDAVPSAGETWPQISSLDLPDRERTFLSRIDGETPVGALLLGAGLRQRQALTLLAACTTLSLIDVQPAPEAAANAQAPAFDPQLTVLDIERLESKFREVQEADYFAILGVTRSAGGEEIHRALERLAAEYDPLRFAGHEDARLQHHARAVQEALTEAAGVLADDRLRQSYARSLVD